MQPNCLEIFSNNYLHTSSFFSELQFSDCVGGHNEVFSRPKKLFVLLCFVFAVKNVFAFKVNNKIWLLTEGCQ